MRKLLLTLALVAAPAIAVAQQPVQYAAQTPAARDTTKTKAKPATSHRHKRITKTKPATTATQDSTKKP